MSLYTFLLATEGPRISEHALDLLEITEALSSWFQTNDDPTIRRFVFGLGFTFRDNYLPGKPKPLILIDNAFLGEEVDLEGSVVENLRRLESVSSVLELFPPFVDQSEFVDRFDCCVLPIEVEELHAAPGDKVYFPPDGRLGAGVTWGQRSGYLASGHVAPGVNSMAFDAGGIPLGPVLWHNDPGASPSQLKDVDVAVIETLPQVPVSGLGARRHFPGSGEPLDLSGTANNDAVFGFCDFIRFGRARATYGEVFLTEQVFSASGDSGALVTSQGRIVGSLVGAYNKRHTSVIQSIGYQLQEIRARGGPNLKL